MKSSCQVQVEGNDLSRYEGVEDVPLGKGFAVHDKKTCLGLLRFRIQDRVAQSQFRSAAFGGVAGRAPVAEGARPPG